MNSESAGLRPAAVFNRGWLMNTNRSLYRALCLAGLLAASGSGFAESPAQTAACPEPAKSAVLTTQDFAQGRVIVGPTLDSDQAEALRVMLQRPSPDGCVATEVDLYQTEGGPPTLEALFIHPVDDEDNLFTIVSWPLEHAGLGTRGRYYSVNAYQETDDGVVPNPRVTKDAELSSGIIGTVEGKPSDFAGNTRQGVIELLAASQRSTSSQWAAECDPEGNQQALNACAFAEQDGARQALDALLAELNGMYEHAPERIADLKKDQQAWEQQLAAHLSALFPVAEGEDPRVLYGSWYPMQHAGARTQLTRQRVEFLENFWVPEDAR